MDTFRNAPCRRVAPDTFFPDGDDANAGIRAAKQICATCPARLVTECARLAVRGDERSGVWAGINIPSNFGPSRTEARRRLEILAGEKFPDAKRGEVVAHLAASGLTAAEIGARLGVGERTVYRDRKAVAS